MGGMVGKQKYIILYKADPILTKLVGQVPRAVAWGRLYAHEERYTVWIWAVGGVKLIDT